MNATHCLMFCLLTCLAVAKAPDRIVVPETEAEVKLDGNLSEQAWQTATTVILDHNTDSRAPRPKSGFETQFRFLHTADALYIGVRCENAFSPNLKTVKRARDGGVYTDECIEIFLDPRNAKTGLQFVINASGCMYDGRIRQGGKWHGDWESKVRISRGVWYVEIRIPFSDLDGRPAKGQHCLINCCRMAFGYGGSRRWLTVLDPPGYHSPSVPLFID